MRHIFLLLVAMGLTTLGAQIHAQTTSVVVAADSLNPGTKVAKQPTVPTLDPGTLHRKPTEEPAATEAEKTGDALISSFPTQPGGIDIISPSANGEETTYDATPRPLQQIQSDQRSANSAIYNLLGCRASTARFRIVNGRLMMVK